MTDDRFTRPARRDTEASVAPPPPRQFPKPELATPEQQAASLERVREILRERFGRVPDRERKDTET